MAIHHIRPQYSTTPNAVPTASALIPGELAVNVHDARLFMRSGSSVVEIGITTPATASYARSSSWAPSPAGLVTGAGTQFNLTRWSGTSTVTDSTITDDTATVTFSIPTRVIGNSTLTVSGNLIVSASTAATISGSVIVQGSITASNFSGSGAAITGVISSSRAISSSYAITSSYSTNAANSLTGTGVLNSIAKWSSVSALTSSSIAETSTLVTISSPTTILGTTQISGSVPYSSSTHALILTGSLGVGITPTNGIIDIAGFISSSTENVGRGIYFNSKLAASANSVSLIGAELSPYYYRSGKTGLTTYGLLIQTPAYDDELTGTTTTHYGLYIGAQSSFATTNYSFYNADSNPSYFLGNVGINTSPLYNLHVNGTTSITGSTTINGNVRIVKELNVSSSLLLTGSLSITGSYFGVTGSIGNSSTAFTASWNRSNILTVTNTGAATVYFHNANCGGVYILKITAGSGASATWTWPSSVKWPSATAPSLTTTLNRIDVITFMYDGGSFFGVTSGQNYI